MATFIVLRRWPFLEAGNPTTPQRGQTAMGSRTGSRSFWKNSGSASLGNNTGRRKLCGRRPKSNVVKEPVPSRPGEHVAQSKVVLTVLYSAVWHWRWWRLRHYCVLQNSRLQEPSLALVRTIQQTQNDFQTNCTVECNVSTVFSLEARKSSSERTIRDILFKKTEAWQTSGTWMRHPVSPIAGIAYLRAFDAANVKTGAERDTQKTEVIYHVLHLDAAPPDWKINEVRGSFMNNTVFSQAQNTNVLVTRAKRLRIAASSLCA